MIVSSIKNLCWRLNRSMKTQRIKNSLKPFPDITTSRWRRRFHSIVRMVQLGIIGLGISICWSLLQLQRLVSYLYDGSKRLLTSILIRYSIQRKWTMLLQVTQTRCISLLRSWLIRCLMRERRLKRSSISWTRLQLRSWNHLSIRVTRHFLKR